MGMDNKNIRVGIVVGEASGDILGAGLIKALKAEYPNATFEGIGGPLMIEQGFTSHAEMERLSVMGLVEVLGRLPELLRIRKHLISHFLNDPPDIVIGIDAPDFNLEVEKQLRERGIKTVHYVSPSVWAWRSGRIKKISQAVDLMLTLLPFEAKFYEDHQVPVKFVGHPLADDIALKTSVLPARHRLGFDEAAKVVAILPGSRGGEVKRLAPVFLEAARYCLEQEPDVRFVIPAASEKRHEQISAILRDYPDLPVDVILGSAHDVLAASNAVLVASGTATLEAALLKKPMVVAYRVAPLTYKIVSRMLKQRYFALPNLLANKELVPEILQDDVTPERLGRALLKQLNDTQHLAQLHEEFLSIHNVLKRNASYEAAQAVIQCMKKTHS